MKNQVDIVGSVAWVTLTRGQKTCLDVADLPLIAPYRWCAQLANGKYRATTEIGGRKAGRTLLMHRVIVGERAAAVDHRDGNPLNNRRRNLRPCSQAQNSRNRRQRAAHNTSGFKGVSYSRETGQWKAYITRDGKQRHLGYFTTAEAAAQAYNVAALSMHGAFARLTSFICCDDTPKLSVFCQGTR